MLVRFLGDISLAEEAVQDAFTTALQRWPRERRSARARRLDHHHGAQPRHRPAAARGVAR